MFFGDYMQKIDTILFDLDGTLVDSNNLILKTFKRTFQLHFSNKILTQNDLIQMMGPPLQETFSRFSSDTNVVNSMINSYRDIYQQIEFDYVKPYPHIIETLKAFKDANFNIGIVTTKFKESAMPSINRFGIDKYIDVIIGLDDVKNHKPHAEPVLKALQ